jgi:hypothetical protein
VLVASSSVSIGIPTTRLPEPGTPQRKASETEACPLPGRDRVQSPGHVRAIAGLQRRRDHPIASDTVSWRGAQFTAVLKATEPETGT